MSTEIGRELLVVDDDPAIGEEICDALALRNVRAHFAADVAQAREALRQNDRIAIVTVDYHMPGMSGSEVIETLEKEFRRPLAFIMITGDGRQQVAVEAIRAHAQDFVPKPIDPRALMAAIGRAEEKLREVAEIESLQNRLDMETRALSERLAVISDKLVHREALLRQLLVSEQTTLSTLSEQIRAPLAPLLDHLSQLKEALSESGTQDATLAQAMMRQGVKLAEVVETIFGDGPQAAAEPLKCHPVDLAGIIKRIGPALRRAAADKQVQLKTRIPQNLPFLFADEGRLAQALSDIATGLIDELSPGDHLAILALAEERSLVLSFRVSAQHLDESLLAALSDTLSRSLDGLEATKPALPKFISSRLVVHLHGGQIDLDDRMSPLRLIKLRFPLPEASQVPAQAARA